MGSMPRAPAGRAVVTGGSSQASLRWQVARVAQHSGSSFCCREGLLSTPDPLAGHEDASVSSTAPRTSGATEKDTSDIRSFIFKPHRHRTEGGLCTGVRQSSRRRPLGRPWAAAHLSSLTRAGPQEQACPEPLTNKGLHFCRLF